jgi:hypothetical protein
VRAAQAYGEVKKLTPVETAVWQMRMFVDAGQAPAVSGLPPLPREYWADHDLVLFFYGVKSLFGCRFLIYPGQPAPITPGFGAAWVGITPYAIARCRRELVDYGCLFKVGPFHRMNYYLPGDKALLAAYLAA